MGCKLEDVFFADWSHGLVGKQFAVAFRNFLVKTLSNWMRFYSKTP